MRLAVNAISHCDRIAVRSVSVCGRRARMTRAEWMVMCSVDWQLEGPCQYNVAEIRVNVDRGDTLPAASIWDPTACQHQHLKGSWNWGGLYKKTNPEISAFVIAYSSVCPLHVVIRVMPWPVATAILPHVLSRTTITSSHRMARKGGISFSPTLLFLAGVSLSLLVQHERHLPTQNQNSHYCAAAKCVVKRTRLIWNQSHFCLPKTINESLFRRLMWMALMQIEWSCTVSLCLYCMLLYRFLYVII